MDNFNYNYYAKSNKLRGVIPIERDTVYTGEINSNNKLYRNITVQASSYLAGTDPVELRAVENIFIDPGFDAPEGENFAAYIPEEGPFIYDAIGNLIEDEEEGVQIEWTPYGKVRQVTSKDGEQVVKYRYDAAGNRIEKSVTATGQTISTRYVRDASGNVMATYRDTTATEHMIYGSSRLGTYLSGVLTGHQTFGRKNYELTNHLGNVLATITDEAGQDATTAWATVESTSDYYPFGLEMEGRSYQSEESKYRYGFNGKEKDGAFAVTNYDYGFRIYNPSIAKFLSVDPLSSSFPFYTPYQFSGNKPIMFIDLDGMEFQIPIFNEFKYGDNPVINTVKIVDNVVIGTANGGIEIVNSGIYTVHKLFTNPTAIPEELKSETQAMISETGKFIEDQYDYVTETPFEQQLMDTKEGFTNPETYEGPFELAAGLFLTRNLKLLKNNPVKTQSISFQKQGKYNFNITADEGNLKFIEVKIGDDVLEFGGDFVKKDGILTIKNFDVDGDMTNKLGIKKLKEIMSDFGKQENVNKVIAEGAPRTTGAKPGKVTTLTFDVE